MSTRPSRSLFTHRLDRIAFVAYFLGAVVPLGALAVGVHGRHGPGGGAWAMLIVAAAVLSLGAFLALRRATRDALGRMDQENRRLTTLVRASWSLAGAQDAREAAGATAQESLALVEGACAVVVRVGDGGECTMVDAFGVDDARAAEIAETLPAADVVRAFTSGRLQSADLPSGGEVALLPLGGEAGVDLAVATVAPPAAFDGRTLTALSSLGGLAVLAVANADLRDAQRNFFSHVTELLAMALDAHLGHHHGHGHRVARLANRVGRHLGMDEEALHRLHFAALLHDVGLLKVPKELHGDDGARRAHARIGADLLQPIRLWESSAPIVLAHHERWDGEGYPSRLAGDEIPIEARILAVCDVFDAITSRTAVNDPRSTGDALEELRDAAGTQLDPDCVQAFLELAESGHLGADVEVTLPLASVR